MVIQNCRLLYYWKIDEKCIYKIIEDKTLEQLRYLIFESEKTNVMILSAKILLIISSKSK